MSEKILMQVLEKIDGLVTGVKDLKEGQEKINDRLDKIEYRLENVEDRSLKIKSKLDVTVEQTAKLSEYHTEVMDKLDSLATKGDLSYIDKELGKHDREIFKLKNTI